MLLGFASASVLLVTSKMHVAKDKGLGACALEVAAIIIIFL